MPVRRRRTHTIRGKLDEPSIPLGLVGEFAQFRDLSIDAIIARLLGLKRTHHEIYNRGQRLVTLVQLMGISDGSVFRPIHTCNEGTLRNFARNCKAQVKTHEIEQVIDSFLAQALAEL
jgi:hypothetical protein